MPAGTAPLQASSGRVTRHRLKNYLARHLWRVMEHHHPEAPPGPANPAKHRRLNHTLTTVSSHSGLDADL